MDRRLFVVAHPLEPDSKSVGRRCSKSRLNVEIKRIAMQFTVRGVSSANHGRGGNVVAALDTVLSFRRLTR